MSHEVGNESISRGGLVEKQPQEVDKPIAPVEEPEMGFLDHLEALRWHILRGVGSVFVFAIIAFIFGDFVFDKVLFGPRDPNFLTYKALCKVAAFLDTPSLCIQTFNYNIISIKLMTQFAVHIQISIAIGLIIGFPYFFWEVWRFVRPGLYPTEQKVSRGATFVVSFLFLSGILFGYFVLTPISLNFLANYSVGSVATVQNQIALSDYLSVITMLTLTCGLMFQLPVVVYFLSKIGFVTPALMREYRRHSIVVVMIVSAVITPPDVFSQILIAMPISLLYEVSIKVSARVEKQRQKAALDFERGES